MKFSWKNWVLLAMIGFGLFIAYGCGQKDDVVKPQIYASLTLRPQYLPELDTLYVYEIWGLKISESHDSTFTSMGKFTWDSFWYRFVDLNGEYRDSVFELPDPYYSYDRIVVSVENRDDPAPMIPSGVFILSEDVIDPTIRPPVLKFPADLFLATGTFTVASPTDDTINTNNENKGVWLCARSRTQRSNNDTLAVLDVDRIASPVEDDPDSLRPDTIDVIFPPGGWEVIDTFVVFSYDTLPHRRINIEWKDTIDFNNNYLLFVDYDIDSLSSDPGRPLGLIPFWNYSVSLENLPDVTPWGWRYNGWVFLEYAPETADLPDMNPLGYKLQGTVTAEADWKVLPLGSFLRPDSADLENPYIDNREVPNFPGEDFILDLPDGYDELDFRYSSALDTTAGRWGVVMVGVEPDPELLTIDATRNFPVMILSGDLPDAEAGDDPVNLFHNYTQFLPAIDIGINFHD